MSLQVTRVKLVDDAGIINPKAFYNYLTAWVSCDALAYSASQASFRPDPKEWTHVSRDTELRIPKSQPLKYAQIPFYLNKMNTTEEITTTIREIRAICQKYEERGLPNFPTGIPFVFWEQYVRLPIYAMSALVVVVALIFLVISIFLCNPQAASLIVTLLVLIVAQLYGLMGLLDIRLSAVPAVILIIAVGIITNVFVPITLVSDCLLSEMRSNLTSCARCPSSSAELLNESGREKPQDAHSPRAHDAAARPWHRFDALWRGHACLLRV